MNKKYFFGIAIVLIIALVGGGVYMIFLKKTETVDSFKLTDYSDFIERFPSEKILGSIDSAQTVKEKAETIWLDIYGNSVKDKKPYNVFFDEQNQVWLVQGTLQKNCDGGVPHILIQKSDGKVLAVWHSK